jgi:hypothetical protein
MSAVILDSMFQVSGCTLITKYFFYIPSVVILPESADSRSVKLQPMLFPEVAPFL